jgi:hypothetical protein
MTNHHNIIPPPPEAPKPSRLRRAWNGHPKTTAAVLGVTCLVLGAGIGASGQEDKPTVETSSTSIITKEVPVPGPTSIVEVPGETVTVEVAPQACIDALDTAAQIFDINAASMGVMSDTFDAISRFASGDDPDGALQDMADNVDKINGFTDDIGALTDPWHQQRDACQAAAE